MNRITINTGEDLCDDLSPLYRATLDQKGQKIIKKYIPIFIKILCLFIPIQKWRRKLRQKYIK